MPKQRQPRRPSKKDKLYLVETFLDGKDIGYHVHRWSEDPTPEMLDNMSPQQLKACTVLARSPKKAISIVVHRGVRAIIADHEEVVKRWSKS